MKKIFKYVCLIFTLSLCLSACSKKSGIKQEKEKLLITAEIYPFYEWTKNIVKDKADVVLLISDGTDIHNWQPVAKNMLLLTQETDLFIHAGGESDFWVEKISGQMKKNGVEELNLMKENESVLLKVLEPHHHDHEGHHHDGDHDADDHYEHHDSDAAHDHENDDHHDSNYDHVTGYDADEYDEHIWLSLSRAAKFVECITEKVCEMDPDNSDYYRANAGEYAHEIYSTHEKIKEVMKGKTQKTLVIADRNPFAYFADDYGLKIIAAFSGCSAESEAGFEVVNRLSNEVDEHKLSSIGRTETGNDKLLLTVERSTKEKNHRYYVLNAMQGKTGEGETYLSIMERNGEVLKEALD